MPQIIAGLYRWGTEKNTAEHFSVAPRPWCLFTRFSPCQCEKALFIGKQHTLVALLQMTHILKPRCFECEDMRHRHGAPSNAMRHLLGKGEAYIWRFCLWCTAPSPLKQQIMGQVERTKGKGFKSEKLKTEWWRWGWSTGNCRSKKTKCGRIRRRMNTEKGTEFNPGYFWRCIRLSGGPPCLVVQKNFPLCLFLSSSCTAHVRLSKDAEKQADG